MRLEHKVAIVRRGTIVYEGTLAELKATAGSSYRLRTTNDARALTVCDAQAGIGDTRLEAGGISFTAAEDAVGPLSRALVDAGALILSLAAQTATLEDLFLSLTEEPLAQAA